MGTVKPLDEKEIISRAKIGPIITLEEHSTIGGLGDSIAAVLAEAGLNQGFKKIGAEDKFIKIVGDQEYLRRENKMDPEQIAQSIFDFFKVIQK